MKQLFGNLIFRNPVQKLLAVSFAIIIWIFAPAPDNAARTEVQFFVPVSYVNLPKNLVIISNPLQTITVSIDISSQDLPDIHPSLFQAVIDLENAEPGELQYELTSDILKIPPNTRVLRIAPASTSIEFEEVIEKILPIKPVLVGEPAEGYVLQKIIMIPEFVKVQGPVSTLSKIERLETRALDINKLNNDVDLMVYPAFPDNTTVVDPKPDFYAAHIQIGSEPVEVLFKNLPIGIINQNYVTKINPKIFNVLLRGPRSLMDNLTKADVQAFIDLQGKKPGTYKIQQPRLRLRPEIQIQKIWPTPINIWVKKTKIE